MRLPERDLAESVLHLAAPLLAPLGEAPSIDEVTHAIDLAIKLWNAHVTASKFWGASRPKPLADLRRVMSGDGEMFARLSERWRQEFAFDPRLVGAWSYAEVDGHRRLTCETTLPEGVEAEVPPPAEKRVAIGGRFLDEVRIRQGASSYVLFPIEHHRGVVGDDGVATIYAKMPSALQLLAEGALPPLDGAPVEVTIGVKTMGPMVLREVHCAGGLAHDVAVLVFRPANPRITE